MRSILYILFALGGVLVAIALSMVLLDDDGNQQVQPQSPSIELSKPPADKAETLDASKDSRTNLQPPSTTPTAPLTIDLARVKPDGAAVFAGTAAPNAKIRIFEGDILLGETIANANGEWVVVLEKSLAAGQHLISVGMERSDGTTEMADRSLAVEIYKDNETKPLVALLPETATEMPVLIQSPDDMGAAKPAAAFSGAAVAEAALPKTAEADSVKAQAKSQIAALVPSAIVWRDASRILISGKSRGGVRVAVNDAKGQFGEALVLADGTWQVAGSLDMDIAVNHLRFTLFDDANHAIGRYDLPIKARDLAKGQDGSPLIVVNKGDMLWRIAYHQLGEGIKYVDIVRRNEQDIADPDLIYPKQIFAVPQSSATASVKD
ncbi:LysM peptidoglycan-binding domain-containing protein [Alphaproteobacteria bacterium]|nr:LysM peptidoglycan-binding domain-containing protein [Alphaproteobacteria bacterium]